MCAIASTIAWLTAQDKTENNFTVGTVAAQVQETFSEPYNEKSDVCIKNTGDIPSYVRVAVSIYWQTEDGVILSDIPVKDTDYTMEWSDSPNWVKQGDLYYYLLPLEPGKNTDNLIENCKQLDKVQSDRKLAVDISVQTIQADPADAVKEAWGIQTETDGTLVLTAP